MATQAKAPNIYFEEFASGLKDATAPDIILKTIESFGDRVALCTSFQAEGMVILDMAARTNLGIRVFTIDTGRLPEDTYDLIGKVRDQYGIKIDIYYPDQDELTQFVSKHGINAFYRSVSLRLTCCEIRKVNPLNHALEGLDAWITGLRRTQSETRAGAARFELDTTHGNIIKLNPLADWSYEQVWDYIRNHDVPYNKLYDKGYTSIGCAPCTRPIKPGEGLRDGRWWWEDGFPKECGIHPGK